MTDKSRLGVEPALAAAGVGAGLAIAASAAQAVGYLPHGVCYTWQPSLMWLHLTSDSLIGLAYFSIPVALVYLKRKRTDLPFSWIFLLFGLFIVACGATHWMEVWTVWHPQYWLSGTVKAVTAAASVPTAIALAYLVPRALAIPSVTQLRAAKEALEAEVLERKRAEGALLEAQAQLEARVAARTVELDTLTRELGAANALLDTLFNQAPVGLGLWDRALRFVRLNDALSEMNGLPKDAHLGRTVAEVLPDVDSHVMEAMRHVRDTGESIIGQEASGMTPAAPGRLRFWSVSYFPVRILDEVVGVGGVCEEVTAKKEAESERGSLLAAEREARAEAEAASRLKDEFLATVSHELRTPLNAMTGWLHLVASGQLDAQAARDAVLRIKRNAQLQARLIDDLLDVSRIITGKLRLEVRRVDPVAVIETAIDTVRTAAEAKRIVVHMRAECPGLRIVGDPDRLQQVVWNLLSNAVKFTQPGGRVEVWIAQNGDQLLLTVRDNGPGIERELLPHVFERFRQGRERAGGQQGLGLGLSIVRHLVELHGGTVEANSAGAGQGAAFTVRLPVPAVVQEQGPEAGGGGWIAPGMRLDGVRVLVVDDEPDARDMLAQTLAFLGATVTASGSVREAMDAIRGAFPDVIVSDISMPGEDGYALVRHLRAYESGGRQTPVIALTALARPEDRIRVLSAGFQMYVAKPVQPDELVVVVASVLGRLGPG